MRPTTLAMTLIWILVGALFVLALVENCEWAICPPTLFP